MAFDIQPTSTSWLRRIKTTLKHWLIPQHHCLLCDTPDSQRLCSHCLGYFARPAHSCRTCGLPLSHSALFCGDCLQLTPIYDAVFSPFLYQTPLDTLINDFKHKGHEFVGKALSDLFCQEIQQHYQQQQLTYPDYIVAVPLHWWRQWQRGFNQSAEFAEAISKHLNITQFTSVKRVKLSQHQQGLTRQQRLRNLTNSFQITESLEGKSIAIVDDVMTTGATVNALSHSLKQAGAGEVSVWTLARTPFRETGNIHRP